MHTHTPTLILENTHVTSLFDIYKDAVAMTTTLETTDVYEHCALQYKIAGKTAK